MAEQGSGGDYTSDPTVPGSSVSTGHDASSSRWKDSKTAKGMRSAGASMVKSGQEELSRAASERITPVSMKRGGKVRKTGLKNLHKNERVIPKGKVKRVEKMMRKAKMRMKARG